jgi:ABC-type phosphate transport system permease subunit
MEAVLVFVAQYFFILFKGLQQINVIKERYAVSMLVSFGLGVCGLLTMGIVAKAVVMGSHWTVYVGFLAGGPVGIVSAIWLEKKYGNRESKTIK